jgi:hypothetical protein
LRKKLIRLPAIPTAAMKKYHRRTPLAGTLPRRHKNMQPQFPSTNLLINHRLL